MAVEAKPNRHRNALHAKTKPKAPNEGSNSRLRQSSCELIQEDATMATKGNYGSHSPGRHEEKRGAPAAGASESRASHERSEGTERGPRAKTQPQQGEGMLGKISEL